jgi:hypothetical protein
VHAREMFGLGVAPQDEPKHCSLLKVN